MHRHLFVFVLCMFQACQLPLFKYLADKVSSLCYERAWYTKMGGYDTLGVCCNSSVTSSWVFRHQFDLFIIAVKNLYLYMNLSFCV